jgi:hypothetical protein
MENSNTVAAFLALLIILWMVMSRKADSIDTSPAILHNATWAGALLIVSSGLLGYDPISGYAWLLIASAILCFNIGVTIAGMRPKYGSANVDPIAAARPLVTRRMYRTLLLGFSVGFAIYLATIASNFGLATLLKDPTSVRLYADVNYLEAFPLYGKVLFYLGPLCLILTIFPEFVQGHRGGRLLWRLAIMAYLAIAQIATLQRTNLVVGFAWAAALLILRLHYTRTDGQLRRLTPKIIASFILMLVVGFVFFQGIAIALGKTDTNNGIINSAASPSIQNSQAISVLYYASSGIVAFGRLADSQNEKWPPTSSTGFVVGDYNPQTWGLATFVGPLKLIPGVRHWTEVEPFNYVPVPTNVYTWLDPWYRDYRGAGVLFGAFFTGIIIGNVVRRARNSPEAMLMAGLLVGLSGFAIFVNRYMTVMSVVSYLALWFLGVQRRSNEASELREERREAAKKRPMIRKVSS